MEQLSSRPAGPSTSTQVASTGNKMKVFLSAVVVAIAVSAAAQFVLVHVVEQSSRETFSRPTARS